MTHPILKVFLILLLLTACNNSPTNTHEQKEQTQKVEIVKPLADKRWEANPETSKGISNMQILIQDFEESLTIENYNFLSTQLETEFAGILKNCTMKGEAHDHLHDYLMPMKVYFADLQSTDISKAKIAYDNLTIHLSQYSASFE